MGNWLGLLIDRKVDPNKVLNPLNGAGVNGGGEEG